LSGVDDLKIYKQNKMTSADLIGKKALIVEDNEALAYIFSEYMSESGVITYFAKNGKEAIQMVTERPYDFILMDIYMPIMNGIEATSRIVSSVPDATIIAITSSNERLECERMKSMGAKDCVTKPVNKEKLIQTVRRNLIYQNH
jgi:two-component system, sensor histidine kinase